MSRAVSLPPRIVFSADLFCELVVVHIKEIISINALEIKRSTNTLVVVCSGAAPEQRLAIAGAVQVLGRFGLCDRAEPEGGLCLSSNSGAPLQMNPNKHSPRPYIFHHQHSLQTHLFLLFLSLASSSSSHSTDLTMAASKGYRPDLLAPYLALPQGEKVQAECVLTPDQMCI